MTRAPVTDEQISKALETALHWRRCGNVFSAKVKIADLRRRLRGEQRQALDHELKKHRFLREVLEADGGVPGRTGFGTMPRRQGA